jgi:hypothetical protein
LIRNKSVAGSEAKTVAWLKNAPSVTGVAIFQAEKLRSTATFTSR